MKKTPHLHLFVLILLLLAKSAGVNAQCNLVTYQQEGTRATCGYISQAIPAKNYNVPVPPNDVVALRWTFNGTPGEIRGLLKFDLSAIPANAIITGARLSLYAEDSLSPDGYGGQPTYGNNNATYLQRISGPWAPDSLTWNSQPATDTANRVLLPQSTSVSQDYLDLDVSTFVHGWVADPASNYGMMLKIITQNHYNSLIFCNSTYPDPAQWPKLEICYSLPCTIAASFTQQNKGGGQVKFTNTSTDNSSFASQWTFYNAAGVIATSSTTNPQITFSGATPYSVKLMINDGSCSDSATQQVDIITCATYQQGNTSATCGYVSSALPDRIFAVPVPPNDIVATQWTFNGTPGEIRGLLKFDLSQIPANAVITSAKLSLYAEDTLSPDGYQGKPTYGTNNASYLQRIITPWIPDSLNWNNQPSSTTVDRILLPQSSSTSQDYLDLDIRTMVQEWVNDPAANYGMMLKIITQNHYNSLIFCSNTYPDPAMWPKLEICYTAAAGPPPPVCNTYQHGNTSATCGYVSSAVPDRIFAVPSPPNDIVATQWTFNGNPGEIRGLLKFDLAQIPANAVITSAKLSLYAADTLSPDGYAGQPTYGNDNASYLQRITSAWDISSLTWNTQPASSTASRILLPQSTSASQDYLDMDVSGFVQGWVDNPAANYGMMLKIITQNYYNSLIFCSSTHPDSTKWPKLEICYTLATTPPPPVCNTYQHGNTSATCGYVSSAVPDRIFAVPSPPNDIVATQWTFNGTPGEIRGLLKFDLSQIPANAVITNAKLSLYAADTLSPDGYGGQPTYGNDNASYLQRITSAWDLSSLTWNTQPATATAERVLLPQSTNTSQDYLDMDISTFVQDWVNDPAANYGLMLKIITQNYYNSLIFCSSTHPDSTKWPKLEICYTIHDCNNTSSSFTYQNLGNGVIQFNNTSASDRGYFNSWAFYNSEGIFATSNMEEPTVTYAGEGPFYAVLSVMDSFYAPCRSVADSLIIIEGVINTGITDTLCGYIFEDANNNGVNDQNEQPAAHAPVLIDGTVYYTSQNGYYTISVGAGLHTVAVVPPFGWVQTTPVSLASYSITTSTNERICGFDFGIRNTATGINDVSIATGMVIFPNPANGSSFSIIIPDGFEATGAFVSITDMTGREVYAKHMDTFQKQLSITTDGLFAAGIYTVSLKNDRTQMYGRLSVIK